ncbi:hypothetical protein KTR66_04735 [Roseococcus sp. SDR]|uniref:hypothetical protein n=1 Tax=Roseococcus sp. SDR TaxID=2835532 RepID=UPI001BCAC831|nr:hypothetical protein [Roseococcus sp. SDR]MBS7789286.1 hypothetical protein [Roseococcus sp. SDR]MBV1844600.1 hypothetical protein [Roseococcus sp. SDR]
MYGLQALAWGDAGPMRLRSCGPVMTPGQPYTHTPNITGGIGPYTLAFAGDAPAGLSISGGTISGTPTASGPYVITATDQRGQTVPLVIHPLAWDGPARLYILPAIGQSNGVGATSNSAGTNDPAGPLTRTPQRGGQVLMFNGGTVPLPANPSAVSKGLVIQPDRYASVVDAREDANSFVQRETWGSEAARAFAASLRPQDRVITFNTGLGGCSFNDLVQGFAGSRATFSGSISGTTMIVTSVSASTGGGLTNELILNHASIAPGTIITAVPDENGNVGVYQVSPAQDVPSFTNATTTDPAPKPWQNLRTLTAAATDYALANGLVPVVIGLLYNQGEAEQDMPLVAQRTTQLNTLRTLTDALKPITGQSQDILIVHPQVGAPIYNINGAPPSNVRNDNPDTSLMQQVSPATLAAELHARRFDARMATFAQYDQASDTTPRVHYLAAGHRRMGQKAGALLAAYHAGRPVLHPHMLRCTGNLGSTTRMVTLSEDAVIDTSLIADPGQRGVRYRDSGGEIAVTDVAISGSTLTLTLATAPNGQGERVDIACSNGLVTGSYTGTSWPFTPPPVYLGPQVGQRSQIRAVRPFGFDEDTGLPLPRYFAHQRLQAQIGSGAGTLDGVFADLGVTPSLILDAGDAACYSGSGQSITDRSPNATAWQLGINGSADETDSGFVAAASGQPAYFLFDGTDSITPAGTVSFADAWHRSGAAFCFFAAFFLPSSPPGANQYLLSTCADTSTGIGVNIRVTGAGRWGMAVRNGSGVVFNQNSTDVLQPGWNVCGIGINAAANQGWFMTTPSMVSGAFQSLTAPYTSPSAGNKSNAASPFIGKTAEGADVNSQRLMPGARIHAVAACGYQTAAKMQPLFNVLAGRVGLAVDLSGNV